VIGRRTTRTTVRSGLRRGGATLLTSSEVRQAATRAKAWRPRAGPGRGVYALAAAAFSVFVVYGSLLPFDFARLPLNLAIEQFSRIAYLPLGIDARADLVANMLLFMPLGYFAIAAIRTDRGGDPGVWVSALMVVLTMVAFAIGLEFLQMFFPSRTVSLNDIGAESAGAVAGVTIWLFVGDMVTEWLRDFGREQERLGLLRRILLAACVLILFSQMLPLDLTINLSQLAAKYREGRIILQPFGYSYSSHLLMAWDYLSDIAINAPYGAAAVLLWSPPGTRRSFPLACLIGVGVVASTELAQIFVYSRYADVTDLITGSTGVALGAAAATLGSNHRAVEFAGGSRPAVNRAALLGSLGWVAAMISYYWYPFNFIFESSHVVAGAHQLFSLPFRTYYGGPEFHAFTEASRKFLMALPLGVLGSLVWHRPERVALARLRTGVLTVMAVAILLGIEAGQVFLPERTPDLTDVLMGLCGFMAGSWLLHTLTPSPAAFSAPHPDYRS
jgi:VanZ family protein